jgi:hypothetical protein
MDHGRHGKQPRNYEEEGEDKNPEENENKRPRTYRLPTPPSSPEFSDDEGEEEMWNSSSSSSSSSSSTVGRTDERKVEAPEVRNYWTNSSFSPSRSQETGEPGDLQEIKEALSGMPESITTLIYEYYDFWRVDSDGHFSWVGRTPPESPVSSPLRWRTDPIQDFTHLPERIADVVNGYHEPLERVTVGDLLDVELKGRDMPDDIKHHVHQMIANPRTSADQDPLGRPVARDPRRHHDWEADYHDYGQEYCRICGICDDFKEEPDTSACWDVTDHEGRHKQVYLCSVRCLAIFSPNWTDLVYNDLRPFLWTSPREVGYRGGESPREYELRRYGGPSAWRLTDDDGWVYDGPSWSTGN